MLDSNVHDLVLDTAGALAAVQGAIKSGRLDLVVTHIQRDELSRVPDPERREKLLAIYNLAEHVATSGAIWDVTNYDDAKFGTDHQNASIDALMGGNPKHAEDALIAASAEASADVLVTNEKRLASRVDRAGFSGQVWGWNEFLDWLGS